MKEKIEYIITSIFLVSTITGILPAIVAGLILKIF